MDTYLRCQVKKGLFSDEVAVRGEAHNKTEFSAFIPEEFIETPARITNTWLDGWIRVEVLDRRGGLLLVRLPGQTFENGPVITVGSEQLREWRAREIA